MKSKPKNPSSSPPSPDLARIDEAVLALLWLTAWTEHADTEFAVSGAWKGHDWEALGRLHEKRLISNPVGKAKSIVFTEEGRDRAKALFERLFCQPQGASVLKLRHRFAPSAEPLWAAIPREAQERILDNVWCGHCQEVRRIEEFTGTKELGGLILRGFCAECGHVVVRVLEKTAEPAKP